jgi:hypothetical protein
MTAFEELMFIKIFIGFLMVVIISSCAFYHEVENPFNKSSSGPSEVIITNGTWAYPYVSVTCPPQDYCTNCETPIVTNLILNNFGPNIQYGHVQTIYGLNGSNVTTNNLLIKEDISIIYGCEQTPIVWNGNLYNVVGIHPPTSDHNATNCYIAIISADGTNNIIAVTANDCQYPSAIVNNGTLYIYATSWGNGQTPWVFYTKDLTNWSSNQIVQNNPPTVFNTSVCYDGSRYVMAMEYGYFYQQFATSPDGTNFTVTTNSYTSKSGYAACATIRYINGYYYLVYCSYESSYFIERITRSLDLANWTDSAKSPMIVPDSYDLAIPTCNNTSDMDIEEYNGQTQIYYTVGNQSSWFNIRRAYYNGSMKDLFEWFFN